MPSTPRLTRRTVAILWIVLSLMWAAVMIGTGEPGWPLIGWTITTFMPLSMVEARARG